MDVLMLSRIQFALTSCFHYIFPPISIGLGLMLVIMEGLYIKTKKPIYFQLTRFWVKIFAVTFALGVATGLVQLFGFGTNWSRYSKFVGDVFGSALGAEGIFAFFLEAGFLGVVLFGWDRVSAKWHYFSTVMVALGAHFSALWIVVANSWMQTPVAYKVVGQGDQARAIVTDFWAMVFNPSSLSRVTHVLIGCWITGVFFVLSVSAYYALKKKYVEMAKIGLRLGLFAALVTLGFQLFSGDRSAEIVAEYQPAKLAAAEGIYKTQASTPISLFGWVDKDNQQVHSLKIPGGLSFLVHGNTKTSVIGLDQFPKEEWPNVPVVFQTYHLMVLCWGVMALLVAFSLYHYFRNTLMKQRWLLKIMVPAVLLPHIANMTGWMTAEIGRQPWLVYNILKTADGVSPAITSSMVAASIIMFIIIYAFLLTLYLYLIDRKIKEGPLGEETIVVFTKNPLA